MKRRSRPIKNPKVETSDPGRLRLNPPLHRERPFSLIRPIRSQRSPIHQHFLTHRDPHHTSCPRLRLSLPVLHHVFPAPEHWHQGHRNLLSEPGSSCPFSPRLTSLWVTRLRFASELLPFAVSHGARLTATVCSMSSNPSLRSSTAPAPANTQLVSARPIWPSATTGKVSSAAASAVDRQCTER